MLLVAYIWVLAINLQHHFTINLKPVYMPDNPKSTFENINDLLKSILWPFIFLIVFFTYKAEFTKIFKILPEKVENSSKIAIGSFSLEIEKTAQRQGSGELSKVIKALSTEGIKKFLTLGSGRYSIIVRMQDEKNGVKESGYALPNDTETLLELEKANLISGDTPIQSFISYFKKLNPNVKTKYLSDNGSYSYTKTDNFNKEVKEYFLPGSNLSENDLKKIEHFDVFLTDNGHKAFDIIVKVTAEQIKSE